MPSRHATEENASLLHDRDSYELEDPYETRTGESRSESPARRQTNRRQSALPWLFALLAAIAATDLLALFYMSRIMNTVYADVGTSDLEFANPYHGLADLYSSGAITASRIDPILNTPRVVAQVFSDRPNELAPVGEHDLFYKAFGTLSPHEKHLQVSAKTHTIAQFRTVDFGMEECSLVIRLPGDGDPVESREPFLFNSLSTFDVFRLAAPKPLEVRTLSYSTRPPVMEKVATVAPGAGETEIVRFPCAWSTLHTFELACAEGADCLLDVWSSQNTTWGVYMYQHQTI